MEESQQKILTNQGLGSPLASGPRMPLREGWPDEFELIEIEWDLDRLANSRVIADEVAELEDALSHLVMEAIALEDRAKRLRQALKDFEAFRSHRGMRRLIELARARGSQ